LTYARFEHKKEETEKRQVAEEKEAKKRETAPQGKKRTFNADMGLLTTTTEKSEVESEGMETAPTLPGAKESSAKCEGGQAPVGVTGPDGSPLKDGVGMPILICPNGQLLQPQAETKRNSGGSSNAEVKAERNRFGGNGQLSGARARSSGKPQDSEETAPQNPAAIMQDYLKVLSANGALGIAGNGQIAGLPETEGASGEDNQKVGRLLESSKTAAVKAHKLENLSMTLLKGKSVGCTLTSRVISEVPGYVSCVLDQNIYSGDGKVVLIEKGSEAVGEYGSLQQNGQERIFAVWSHITTPNGIRLELESPSADELGTSGMSGEVDNRWGKRIGAALLLSIIQDSIDYEVARQKAQSGTYFDSSTKTGESLAEKVLDSTINLKSLLRKNQGEKITIFVARDVDFGSVYELRTK